MPTTQPPARPRSRRAIVFALAIFALPILGLAIVALVKRAPAPLLTNADDPVPLGGTLVGAYPYFGLTVRTYATFAAEDEVVADYDHRLSALGYAKSPVTIPTRWPEQEDKRVRMRQWRRGKSTVRLFFEPTPYVYSTTKGGVQRRVTPEEGARVAIVELDAIGE